LERDANIVVVSGGAAALDKDFQKAVRGSLWQKMDRRFAMMVLLSIGLHSGTVMYFRHIEIAPQKTKTLEEIPERFAKLIIEKPLPKEPKKKPLTEAPLRPGATDEGPGKAANEQEGAVKGAGPSTAVKKNVARQVARVDQKIRTVGVLGMLTGVGSTAKGPSVVDVLGVAGNKKERTQDLDKALAEVSGLRQTQSMEIVQRKLVKSKDVEIARKESIDDLIANIGAAKTTDLSKKGDIVISRPESIEGAASSSAKRDISAINAVVASHKQSVRMSYERFLKKSPDLAGKITIRFTIDAGGSVTRLEILENTTGNTELEDEILRKVKMWKFEEIPEGEVTITYPLIFQPAA
jgi:TonB family protein